VAVGDLRIETPTSALMAADPDFPAPAPSSGEQFDAFTAMAAHDYVGAARSVPGGTDMVLFSTGFGDGIYPLFVGLDADGRPARYVLDFRVLRRRWR
jgi:hypothetical protein